MGRLSNLNGTRVINWQIKKYVLVVLDGEQCKEEPSSPFRKLSKLSKSYEKLFARVAITVMD